MADTGSFFHYQSQNEGLISSDVLNKVYNNNKKKTNEIIKFCSEIMNQQKLLDLFCYHGHRKFFPVSKSK